MKSNAQMRYGALALAGLCLLLGSVANAAPTGKIEICHKPGERNQRILLINEEKDGEKHFGHGDYEVQPEVCDGLDSDCEKPPVADNDVDCTDGIACTDDSCNGSLGCFSVPNDALCIDGPPNTVGTCSTTEGGCTYTPTSFCGDGNTDQGEQCDDGNDISNDGCSTTCEVTIECPCIAFLDNPRPTSPNWLGGLPRDPGPTVISQDCLTDLAYQIPTTTTTNATVSFFRHPFAAIFPCRARDDGTDLDEFYNHFTLDNAAALQACIGYIEEDAFPGTTNNICP